MNTFDTQEEEIRKLKQELARLKAPPSLNIIRHGDHDPHPRMVQMVFEWQGYQHRAMAPREIYGEQPDYRKYIFRAGVEATVRAFADAMMDTLVETDETFQQHYLRKRDRRQT